MSISKPVPVGFHINGVAQGLLVAVIVLFLAVAWFVHAGHEHQGEGSSTEQTSASSE